MHITKLASLYIPLSIVCAVIISPTGPQGWIDQQIGENTHRGLFCRQKWIPFLARVFDPIRNPAAHNPNVRYESLLRICATTSWGGNPDGNAGAVCSSLTPDPFQIMFDYRNGGGALRADKELAILCRTRCYCTGGTSGLLALPGRSPMPQHNIYLYRAKPGSVSMTEPIIQTVHNALTQASLCYESVSEGAEGISVFREDCFRSSEEDAQKLQCQGAIPIPNFPQLFRVPYTTIRSFCATSFVGGSSRGNAGLLCENDAAGNSEVKLSVFDHPEFRPEEKFYCLAKCTCASDPQSKKRKFESDRLEIKDAGNGFTIHQKILGAKCQVNYHYSGSNAVSLKAGNVCNIPPLFLYNFRHKPRIVNINPDFDPVLDLPVTTAPSPVCNSRGTSCRTNHECGAKCSCFVDRASAIQQEDGSDGRFQFQWTFCGTVPLFQSYRLSAIQGLGKRSINQLSGYQEPICPCNGTYVSEACCRTTNGIVWEDSSMKQGVLGILNSTFRTSEKL